MEMFYASDRIGPDLLKASFQPQNVSFDESLMYDGLFVICYGCAVLPLALTEAYGGWQFGG